MRRAARGLTLLVLLAAVAGVAVVAAWSPRAPLLGPRFSARQGLTGPLQPGRPLVVDLDPYKDGLSEIGFYFRAKDAEGIELEELAPAVNMRLLDGQTLVRSATIEHPSDGELRFRFTPVPDSGRRHLTVELEVSQASAIAIESFAPTSAGTHLPPQPRVRYGKPEPAWQQFPAAIDRASQYRPEPFKGGVLVAILVLWGLAMTGLLAWMTSAS
jgi:hypothetical protein